MLFLFMSIYFSKYEEIPENDPYYSLGLYNIIGSNDEKEKSLEKRNSKFPLYEYPNLYQALFETKPNIILANNRSRYINSNIKLDDHPCLFLEFADVDLTNKNEILKFVEKYGFLTRSLSMNSLELILSLKTSKLNEGIGSLVNNILYGESFEMWIRFQLLIRTLITVWRYLKNTKIKRKSAVNPENPQILYERYLFQNEGDKLYFSDIINDIYIDQFYTDKPNFYNEQHSTKDHFKNFNIWDFNKKLDLTHDFQNHNPDFHHSFRTSQNFLEHFAEEFLRGQLNLALEKLSPKIRLRGYVSFTGENESNMHKNFTCQTLAEAIVNQLIDIIIKDEEFVRCLECQKWMTSGRKKTERKNYCSKQCRSQAYERRKRISQSDEIKNLIRSTSASKIDNYTSLSFDELFRDLGKNIKNKNLLENIIRNIFSNKYIHVLEPNICVHLGIDLNYINFLNNIISRTNKMRAFNVTPYYDWDF